MKDDVTDRIFRDMAASGLVAAIRPPSLEWEKDPSFSLANLPVDPHPWFGGTVEVKVPLPQNAGWTKAPFIFWTANEEIVWIDALFHGAGPSEFGYSLIDAMARPMVGEPRRPAKVFMQNAAMAAALREPAPDMGHDIPGLIEIGVKQSPDDLEQVIAFLDCQAEILADQKEE